MTPAAPRSLLGNRGRALYPPRTNPTLQSRRGAPAPTPSGSGFFSRQSLMLLTVGVLFGYLLLPVLLVQHLGFEDLQPSTAKTMSPTTYEKLRTSNKQFELTMDVSSTTASANVAASSRHLSPSEETTGEEVKEQEPEDIMPELPAETENEEEAKEEKPKKIKASDIKLVPEIKAAATADKPETGTTKHVSNTEAEIQQRLVENQDYMSKQSIPTSTTPEIMMTAILGDHHRMKILVTGGAGFVGSHLVDKLMMEGHEVIVADNFFTGQKKNIAHWLHHPNFR
jgi:hypothetical protein